METVLYVVLWGLSIIVALFIGGFAKSYMSKKGENAALKEDIAELTRTTKRIEAEISGDVWDQQKLWELKREVLFEVTKSSGELRDIFTQFLSICEINHLNRPITLERRQVKIDSGNEFLKAQASFDNATMLVGVVCERDVYLAALRLGKVTRDIFLKSQPEDAVPDDGSVLEFTKRYLPFHDEVRKELGVAPFKVKSQPTESSAVPNLAGKGPAKE